MVSPNAEPEKPDRAQSADHRFITEYRLPGKREKNMRSHAHPRQDGNVNLGMPKEPEQVLPKQRRTTGMGSDRRVCDDETARNEKARSRYPVEQQQQTSREQYTKSQQAQNSRNQPGPHRQGHTPQGHSLGSQIYGCRYEVKSTEQRGDAENRHTDYPQRLPRTFARSSDLAQSAQCR